MTSSEATSGLLSQLGFRKPDAVLSPSAGPEMTDGARPHGVRKMTRSESGVRE
jgi:hypothetical protein